MWDFLEGLVHDIIAEENIFCCILSCYVVQFVNYMPKFEETAVSFAVEKCSFVSA
jgi:hypothetical protein